jgi:hypothetical protein
MNRALTLLLIAIITGFTISIRSSLAQGNRGTFTQGTLTCQVDSPSAHCARNFCEGIILYTNTVCNPFRYTGLKHLRIDENGPGLHNNKFRKMRGKRSCFWVELRRRPKYRTRSHRGLTRRARLAVRLVAKTVWARK